MALSTASRADVRDQILSLLARESALTARQISDALGISKVAVNQVLHGSLKTKLVQDSSYRWSLAGAGVAAHTPAAERAAPRTELGRLCRYYLECISWDTQDGISAFASGRFDLDYIELEKCPFLDGATDPLDSDPARELIRRARRDRTRVLHVGYPVRLRHQRGKSGWEGFFVDPVLLFDLDDDGVMADAPPQLNFAVLKSLPRTGSGHLIDEAIELANELGLASPAAELPDSEDLVLRLRRVRADWDWREEIDPYQLSAGQPLAEIYQAGIYNRAVLIASERSPFILGLETELDRLARIDEDELRGTALADWLSQAASAEVEAETSSLLEPLPLNSEQRHAVRRALRNPLTVITGPPGTGKSQRALFQ
jgi:hypothetical protein